MTDLKVLDASVAAKWFLQDEQETHIDEADELLLRLLAEDIELHAPRVINYEVCNLLRAACFTRDRATGTFRLTKEKAARCAREFFSLPIQIYDMTEEEYVQALEMGVDYSKKYNDMTYIKLAERLGCQWCTADEKVLESVPARFPRGRVLLLSTM